MKNFHLEIVTPEQQVFTGDVQSVTVPGTNGNFQVLFNHAPIISTLGTGKVKVVNAEGEQLDWNTKDGVIEVLKNNVVILVQMLLDD